jgi:hypothetical protein
LHSHHSFFVFFKLGGDLACQTTAFLCASRPGILPKTSNLPSLTNFTSSSQQNTT